MLARQVLAALLALSVAAGLPLAVRAAGTDELVSGAGVVTSVEGEASVHSGGMKRQAVEGLVLEPGDTLVVRAGGSCTGITTEGEFFLLEGPGELLLPVAPTEGLIGRVASWVGFQIRQWAGASRKRTLGTRTARDRWAHEVEVPLQLIPAPDGSVRGSSSEFRWAGAAGATVLTVVLVSEDGERTDRLVRGRSLRLDDLVPGQEYVWKLELQAGERSSDSPWRSFTVMTDAEESSLKTALDGLGDLEAGFLLLSSGLHKEAIARFDVAVSEEVRAHSARLWRARALAEVGLHREAYEDLLAAGGVQ